MMAPLSETQVSEKPISNTGKTRTEEDLLGEKQIPYDAYYGIHTLRAIENFSLSNTRISDVPALVQGMVMTKKSGSAGEP